MFFFFSFFSVSEDKFLVVFRHFFPGEEISDHLVQGPFKVHGDQWGHHILSSPFRVRYDATIIRMAYIYACMRVCVYACMYITVPPIPRNPCLYPRCSPFLPSPPPPPARMHKLRVDVGYAVNYAGKKKWK